MTDIILWIMVIFYFFLFFICLIAMVLTEISINDAIEQEEQNDRQEKE